ncbi:MAG: hypothetical protein HYZ53_28470 [Planctomycetes bacterium]|nr:hypothetical protein [Planctomycetota bacterium]
MYAERRVIDRVREVLGRQDQTVTPELRDLAQQYADLRRRIASRLEECAGLLARGLHTEARHVASSPPSLLEMARILQAEDLAPWLELCLSYELVEPCAIAPDLVEMLECALDDDRQEARRLEKLGRTFRRVALLGSTRESLSVLRQIRALDAKNAHWVSDVLSFEEERLRQIQAELETAARREDETRLAALLAETTSGEWGIKPALTLVSRLQSAHHASRRKRLLAEARRQAAAIAAAYSALDFAALDAALRRWTELEPQEDFAPDESLERQVEDAREWHAEQVRRRVDDEAFAKALQGLRHFLETEGALAELEKAHVRALSFQRELPEDLALPARRRIESIRLSLARAQRLKTLAIVSGLAVLVALLVVLGHEQVQARHLADWRDRVDAAIRGGRWSDAQDLLSALAAQEAALATQPEMIERRSQVEAGLRQFRERREALEESLRNLQRMAEAEFRPLAHAEALLAKAQALAQDEEDRLKVERLRTQLAGAKAAELRKVDDAFLAALAEVEKDLSLLETSDAVVDPGKCAWVLDRATVNHERAVSLAGQASPSLVPRLEPIRRSLDLKRQHVAAARRQVAERQGAVERLYSALPDFAGFQSSIEELAQRTDLERPETEQVRRLRGLLPLYRELRDSGSWTFSEDSTTEEMARNAVSAAAQVGSPFHEALGIVQEACRAWEIQASVQADLNQFLQLPLVAKLKRAKARADSGDGPIRTFYLLDDPQPRAPKDNGYDAIVLDPETLKGLRQRMFPVDGDLRWEFLPHVEYCRKLCTALSNPPRFTFLDFLLKQAQALSEADTIEPVVSVVLLQKLIGLPSGIADPTLSAFQDVAATLSSANTNFYWLSETPATLKAEDALRELIQGFRKMAPRLDAARRAWLFKKEIALKSVNRCLRLAGQVQRVAGQRRLLVSDPQATEAWIVREGVGGAPGRLMIVADCADGKATLRSELEVALVDGEPLWTPTRGRSTEALVTELAQRHGMDRAAIDAWSDWPAAWPVNERRLRSR